MPLMLFPSHPAFLVGLGERAGPTALVCHQWPWKLHAVPSGLVEEDRRAALEAGTAANTVVRSRSSSRRRRPSGVTHRPSMWGTEGGVCDSRPRELALRPRCLSKHNPRGHRRWPVPSRADLAAGPRAAGAPWLLQVNTERVSLFHCHKDGYKRSALVQQPVVQQLASAPKVRVGPSWPAAAERRDKALPELAHRLLTNLNQTGMGVARYDLHGQGHGVGPEFPQLPNAVFLVLWTELHSPEFPC